MQRSIWLHKQWTPSGQVSRDERESESGFSNREEKEKPETIFANFQEKEKSRAQVTRCHENLTMGFQTPENYLQGQKWPNLTKLTTH